MLGEPRDVVLQDIPGGVDVAVVHALLGHGFLQQVGLVIGRVVLGDIPIDVDPPTTADQEDNRTGATRDMVRREVEEGGQPGATRDDRSTQGDHGSDDVRAEEGTPPGRGGTGGNCASGPVMRWTPACRRTSCNMSPAVGMPLPERRPGPSGRLVPAASQTGVAIALPSSRKQGPSGETSEKCWPLARRSAEEILASLSRKVDVCPAVRAARRAAARVDRDPAVDGNTPSPRGSTMLLLRIAPKRHVRAVEGPKRVPPN